MSANSHRLRSAEAEEWDSVSQVLVSGFASVITGRSLQPLLPLLDLPLVGSQSGLKAVHITDEVLLQFQRCARRAFLDLYGDSDQRDKPTDYLSKLKQDSIAHQHDVLSDYQPVSQLSYPRHAWKTAAAATLDLMQQGVDRIAQGVLQFSWDDRTQFVGYPKLLVRQPGTSVFGDWLYVPVDIKLGKRPKVDYQIICAFHTYLLSLIQGTVPLESWLILRQRGSYAVNLIEMLPRMAEILRSCVETLRSADEPEVFISHSRCDLCHWFSNCHRMASSEKHLSLLPGVTPTRYVYLQELKLLTVEALAAIEPKKLAGLPGFGPQVAHKLIRQAQSVLHNQAFSFIERHPPTEPLLTAAELPIAAVELYFDIEAAPEHNLTYLHGVLVVDRQAQTEEFHALLAETPEEEEQVWQQFLELVGRYPDAPIFHFCPYEAQTIRKLAKTYGLPDDEIQGLLQRFVDVHERVTRIVVMPIESYALKPIARWIGFNWRDSDANGAQSICWFDQWQSTGERFYLDAILRYNEDDCRATRCVKDWLVDFVHSHTFAETQPASDYE